MFPRGLCFSECSDAPVPSQTKNQRQQAGAYGAGPLALILTTKGELECSAVVHPMRPEESLRRNSARRPQPLPAAAAAGENGQGDEDEGEDEESAETEQEEGEESVETEEDAEEEGEVKVRFEMVFLLSWSCWRRSRCARR